MIRALLVLIATAPAGLFAQVAPLTASEVAAWREDVRTLGSELPRRHKNAFAKLTRAQWDSAVLRLDERLPRLRRHEVIVEIMRLAAMVRDR
ncbi:MAG: hypothetical protein ACT4P6_03415 [Gemmatimonadaceae bacterium]